MDRDQHRSFGVFKPVGHVVISFPAKAQAEQAAEALGETGLEPGAVQAFTDREMVTALDEDMAHAGTLAKVGQEYNLVRAQRELAERGYHFLVVHAPGTEQAAQVAEVARRAGAERAQSYGTFIIEELIERPGELSQVGESPDRGLDAQTPSGEEAEAAAMKQREKGRP